MLFNQPLSKDQFRTAFSPSQNCRQMESKFMLLYVPKSVTIESNLIYVDFKNH